MTHLLDLKKKFTVVTGANGFLGRVFIEAISENNGNFIAIDKNINGLKKYVTKLNNKFGTNSKYYKCDITKINSLKNIIKTIKKNKLDVTSLVNAAAINPKYQNIKNNENFLENMSIKKLKNEFEVGLFGSLNCTIEFGKYFASRKNGNIINISSDLGVIAPNQTIYNNSKIRQNVKPVSYSLIKHALIGLTKYTSTYWNDQNIRCNSIAPGGIFENQDKDFLKRINKLIPLKRMGYKNELKGVLILLLSDASTYINGQVILVDGGRSVW